MPRPRATIHTDGACRPNPGPGGWAAIVRTSGQEQVLSGGEPHSTNNRMELQAAIAALGSLDRPSRVELHTDSNYLKRGITEWLPGWVARGWRKSDRKPVENVDLWKALHRLTERHQVNWLWVRAHSGDPLNERVDGLAYRAIPDQVFSPAQPTGGQAAEEGRSSNMQEEAKPAAGGARNNQTSPTPQELLQQPAHLNMPTRHNAKLSKIVARVNEHRELQALWRTANVTAVDRLHMSDHGPVHVQIIANSALRLLRLIVESGVAPNVVSEYGLQNEDAEVVVVLAALLHDIGMSIHRSDHERYSLFLAAPLIHELLDGIYDVTIRTVIASEVLHAIIAHRSGGEPLTLEAGIVRVADALDMTKGRSRIPFEAGQMNIHSVSAAAIEKLEIKRGKKKPVLLSVLMSNSAGIFQIDQLLKDKLLGSGLEPYVEVEAHIEGEETKLIQRYQF